MEKLTKEIERREKANAMAPFPVYDTGIINDIKDLNMITKKQDYNNVPVTYCKTCLKLHVKDVTFQKDGARNLEKAVVTYCVDCGNTDLEEAHISEWEDMYEEKYGERFLTEKKK
jgi:RNase P subunit RPR2